MMRMRQLQDDVNEREQAELRRLEGASQVVRRGGAAAAPPVHAQGGAVVTGAVRRSEQVSQKLFASGGFRETSKIKKLLPRGSAGLKAKVPKRKDFGAEGEEGDLAHAQAMKELGILEFGAAHVKDETMETRMNYVGLFGHWLQRNNYGKLVEWRVSHGAHAGRMSWWVVVGGHCCVHGGWW